MAEGFKIAAGYVTADIDTEGLKERAQSQIDEALSGVKGKVPVGLDMARLDADIDEARSKIESLSEARAEPRLGLATGDFDAALDHAREQFDQFHEAEARPRVGLDDDDFREKIDRDKADLDELGAKRKSPKVGLDDGEFKEKLAQDTSSFNAFGMLTAHPMIESIVGGVSALLPGIGGAAAGLGLLGGAGALAFGPILKALQAHQQGSQQLAASSGQNAAQLAETEFQNAVAVQQAQQAVQQALQQSAQDAKTSAQAIISAQEQVVMAEQQVGNAEQALGDAQFSERDAQVNLTNARIQARLTLEQLNDAEKDSVLGTRSAKLALQQAEYQQQLTDQNAMSTQLDREQAALAVAQAQRQVTEAQQNQTNSAAAADRANKLGVNGSQQVVDAQHAVVDAVNAVKNAEQQLQNARRAVLDAVRAEAFAEEQAAYQRKRDAEAVKQAQLAVTDTIKEQQLAMAATLASEQSAMAQFGADYQRLTPQAQAFVNQLLNAGKAFRGLQDLAEKTILPGASAFLRGLMSDLPVIRSAVGQIGRDMSGWLSMLGRYMATGQFKTMLTGLLDNGIKFVNVVVPAVGKFLGTLAEAGSKKGAAGALADVLGGIADGLSGVVKGVEPFIPKIDTFFGSLAKLLPPVGNLLGDVVGGLATIAAPLVKNLLPGVQAIVVNLGPSLVQMSKVLAPAFGSIGKIVSQILITGAPILEFLAHVVGWVVDFGKIATGWTNGDAPGFVKAIGSVTGGVGDLVKAADALTKAWDTAKNGLLTAWHDITGANGWGGFGSFFEGLVGITSSGSQKMQGDYKNVQDAGVRLTESNRTQTGLITTIWDGFTGLFEDQTSQMTTWVAQHWDSFIAGAKAALFGGVTDMGAVWHRLEGYFTGPVDYLINTVYTQGIRRLWDDVVGAIGLGSLKLPPISGLASGGIVPGRDRGRDERLVAMRPGEGVLVPEAVRGLGGPGFVHAANAAFGSGRSGGGEQTAGGLLGFKHGGILSIIDKGLGDLLGGAKFAAELIINPEAAITGLLDKAIGTNATGNMADVMKAIPHALIGDMAKSFAQRSPLGSMGYGTQGGLGGTATGRQIVNFAESFIGRVPYVWGGTSLTSGVDCSGYVMDIYEHFGFNPPRTSETQWDWVQRVPTPVLGGLAFFAGGDGTVSSPGHVGIVTGTNQMVDAYGTGFGVRLNDIYTSSGGVSGFGVPPGGGLLGKTLGGSKGHFGSTYDSGGWLMPGGSNQTGQPEAILTPAESQAWVALVRQMLSQGAGGGRQPVIVNQSWYGPQMPTTEMQAAQRRDLALMLG